MKLHRRLVCILMPVLLFSACSPGGNSSSGGGESRVPPVQSSSASSEALESAAPEFDGVTVRPNRGLQREKNPHSLRPRIRKRRDLPLYLSMKEFMVSANMLFCRLGSGP